MNASDKAQLAVNGDRQSDYGHPSLDFTRTGKIWGAILGIPPVSPELVALCMVGLKISREVNKHKEDNIVDGIGYWLTLEKVIEKQNKNVSSSSEG